MIAEVGDKARNWYDLCMVGSIIEQEPMTCPIIIFYCR